jgi:hypothetical protein
MVHLHQLPVRYLKLGVTGALVEIEHREAASVWQSSFLVQCRSQQQQEVL